ncbi:hypothetical protein BD779DRAFT_1473589 [Infundibulicybe gibba]|nr:hypothetical protein BD779DRAFT_1473589 [Infundibulicybe gibba]
MQWLGKRLPPKPALPSPWRIQPTLQIHRQATGLVFKYSPNDKYSILQSEGEDWDPPVRRSSRLASLGTGASQRDRRMVQRKQRREKRALLDLVKAVGGGIAVDPTQVAGPSKDSLDSHGLVLPKIAKSTASAAKKLKETDFDLDEAQRNRELRRIINEDNRYALLALMEWQAGWLLELRKHIKPCKAKKDPRKRNMGFGVCSQCGNKITNGQLFVIKFDPLKPKKSLLGSKETDSPDLCFSASTTHLGCTSNGTMTHLVRRSQNSVLTATDSFFVHPNVKKGGWIQFMEKYAAVLAANGISNESLDLDPPFWPFDSSVLTGHIDNSPPQIFWNWAKAIDRGDSIGFSEESEPGDAGMMLINGGVFVTTQRPFVAPSPSFIEPESSDGEVE